MLSVVAQACCHLRHNNDARSHCQALAIEDAPSIQIGEKNMILLYPAVSYASMGPVAVHTTATQHRAVSISTLLLITVDLFDGGGSFLVVVERQETNGYDGNSRGIHQGAVRWRCRPDEHARILKTSFHL